MRKRMTLMVIALFIVFGGIIAFNLFKSFMIKRYFAHYQSPSVTVSSVMAVKKNWEPRIAAVGNFVAMNGVDVNSQASGNVVAIHFTSGQSIEKDQPLIDIDDTVDQATLKFNQAELALQTLNYKRQTDLLKRNATSGSSVDEAHAKLLEAQANVEKTQALIQQKHIKAPFSGQIGIRQIDLGQYIMTGQTPIVALQSMDPIFLEFYLPEQLLGRLHINQPLTFSVEQNARLRFNGVITAINAKIDTNTHTIKVQATLPNCPTEALKDPSTSNIVNVKNQLVSCNSALNAKNKVTRFNFMPGMFASIEVNQPAIPNVVVLPSTAISYTLYGDSVFVIEKDTSTPSDDKNGDILRVKRVFIRTGEQQGNDTQILEGIQAGQQVVSSGELKLQDGTRVTINNDVQLNSVSNTDQLGQ
ncbi:MAG TPA: efflux transporter periplasmic adaptor subunit [Legionella sp.]|nr:efflux transporter periplasmic adaptor subunit [Legionella sp.]